MTNSCPIALDSSGKIWHDPWANTIEKENSNSVKECYIELLVRWLHQEGRDATAGKLAEALIRINL